MGFWHKRIVGVTIGCLVSLTIMTGLWGCATIISGSTQEVTFQSEPEGATVKVNGRPLGKTPITIQLDKKSDQSLTFELDGYKTISTTLSTSLDPWFWGNIVIGGLIGSTTDGISGAVYQYSPNQYFVSMHPINGFEKPQKAKAREYIVSGYKNIINELNSTPAEYVTSLLEVLGVKQEDRESAIQNIKKLSEIYQDIPTFAREVSDLFLK